MGRYSRSGGGKPVPRGRRTDRAKLSGPPARGSPARGGVATGQGGGRSPRRRRDDDIVRFGGFRNMPPENSSASRTGPYRARRTQQQRRPRRQREEEEEDRELRSLQASEGSIYRDVLRDLGGLVRWYEDKLGNGVEKTKSMYSESGCSIQGTKEAMLEDLCASSGVKLKEEEEEGMDIGGDGDSKWIDLSMVLEDEGSNGGGTDGVVMEIDRGGYTYVPSYDGRGLILPTVERTGDGPAHAHETWTNVIVPSTAVDKSYYFTVHNRSPVDLSCEISIDGHSQKAAKNVPIPAGAKRTIKPEARYYGTHKWVFSRAERVKLQVPHSAAQQPPPGQQAQPKPRSARYNGVRPKDTSGRVSLTDYPDPASPPYNWTFTGSKEESRVEFFEKRLNMGLVKMDFYYTTGTCKTVLDHPTCGRNDLFRKCSVSPDVFKQILVNPRAHTNVGYRTKEQGQALAGGTVDESTGDDMAVDSIEGSANGNGAAGNADPASYPAKNDEYNFDEQGHANRKAAMDRMRRTNEFRAWEEAQKKEFACVHAKFFVSMARTRRGPRNPTQGRRNNTNQAGELPAKAPVVDVKASERAVLTTEFKHTGGSGGKSMPLSSRVRMERVWGLNDRPNWKAKPLFERKLYYRIESALAENYNGDGSDLDDLDDDASVDGNGTYAGQGVPGARQAALQEETPLDLYRKEKIEQMEKWHGELTPVDQTAALEMLRMLSTCRDGIRAAASVPLVDEMVKQYFDWHQKQQWQ